MMQSCNPLRLSGIRRGMMGIVLASCVSPFTYAAGSPPAVATTSSFVSLLQVFLGLGLVLLAIAGTAWLLRHFAPGRIAASGSLRVVGGVAVGPKERIVLVDVGETRLVVGVAPGHVSLLHQMTRPDEEPRPLEPVTSVFQDKLFSLLNQKKSDQHAP